MHAQAALGISGYANATSRRWEVEGTIRVAEAGLPHQASDDGLQTLVGDDVE